MAKSGDNIIKNALILFSITVIAGMLLGLTFEITKEPIRLQQEKLKNNALQSVVTSANEFTQLDVMASDELPGVEGVYAAKDGEEVVGYAFEMTATEGYGGDISMMVGIGLDNTVLGIDVVKHAETPGLGAKADEEEFKSEFAGEVLTDLSVVKITPSDNPGEVSSISGATITSRSVTNATNVAINYYIEYIKEVD